MKRFLPVLTAVLVGSIAFGVEQTVNQGTPGTRGPWPVTAGAGSSGTGTASSLNAKYPTAQTTVLTINATPCTAIAGASCTTIYTATDWGQWSNLTISLTNTDGANAITNVLVEWSPDGTHYELWDSTAFAALAAGATKSIAIAGNSRRYLRIEARAAATVTSAVVTITANDG